jgi:pimeloyl-ACP methyl ester carboxylesterase
VKGTFSTFDFPNCPTSFCQNGATGINNAGEIVGFFEDADNITHGYWEVGGVFHEFDFQGSEETTPYAVNDKGIIVGSVQTSTGEQGFEFINGQFTLVKCPTGTETFATGIDNAGDLILECGAAGSYKVVAGQGPVLLSFPGASLTQGNGIDNLDDVVGHFFDSNNQRHGFLLAPGNPTAIGPKGSVSSFAAAINDNGDIVGTYNDGQTDHGFLASGPQLVDPVPDLMSGPAVASASLASVGLGGRVVKSVAADGVTEVVVRIPAQNAGDHFEITLMNDQGKVSDATDGPDQDGALGNPGDTTFSKSQITVTAINVTTDPNTGAQAPLAFAVYLAPIDFARETASGSYMNGACPFASSPAGFAFETAATPPSGPVEIIGTQPITDDNLACRSVSLQISNLSDNTSSNLPIIILRPPVVMVHGLWDNWTTWKNFKPLVSPTGTIDRRFYIGRVSYDHPVPIFSSDPPYTQDQLQKATANSLGFAFNAPTVLAQTDYWIGNFKQSNNPVGLPAAAVQADIVAHSMGGDIARTMVLQAGFLSNNTFGQGPIHKLITIDTPHLGSPLASTLLSPQERGGCIENDVLPFVGHFVFNDVSFGGSQDISGAMADLAPSSAALQQIAKPGVRALPSALIAGVYTSLSALDTSGRAELLRVTCGTLAGDPLAKELTSSGWPSIFSGEDNDAIVPLSSQLNNNSLATSNVFVFVAPAGYVHSQGTEKLGFAGPSVLDPGDIPNQVIKLLNTPVTQPAFASINP